MYIYIYTSVAQARLMHDQRRHQEQLARNVCEVREVRLPSSSPHYNLPNSSHQRCMRIGTPLYGDTPTRRLIHVENPRWGRFPGEREIPRWIGIGMWFQGLSRCSPVFRVAGFVWRWFYVPCSGIISFIKFQVSNAKTHVWCWFISQTLKTAYPSKLENQSCVCVQFATLHSHISFESPNSSLRFCTLLQIWKPIFFPISNIVVSFMCLLQHWTLTVCE